MRAAILVVASAVIVSTTAPVHATPAPGQTGQTIAAADAGDRRLSDLQQLVRAHALVIAAQRQMLDGLANRLDELSSRQAPAAVSAAPAPEAAALPPSDSGLKSGAASLEPSAMAPDRPGFGEGADVVGRGQFEVEAGVTYVGAGHLRTLSAPNTLVRVGILDRLEVRIGSDGLSFERGLDAPRSGASDLRVSAKVRLLDQDAAGLDLSIVPVVSLPVGTGDFSSGGLDPTVKLVLGRGLPAGFSVGSNVVVSAITDAGGRFTQKAISAGVSHAVGAGWNGFVEGYAVTPSARGAASAVALDWGATRQMGANAQIDFEAGRGLTPGNWFVGFGVSVRHALWSDK